jgi:hypothetical protein
MVWQRMPRIIKSKETRQIAVFTASKRSKWNKKRKYMKDKINEIAMNSKNKNIAKLF